ncbi:hypothetical protein [Microbispora sp. NPDC049125]|uniref:hypothetical protein n=1 Tax=Microbispora sp. NPDC049125 TaxID=3154929 RepID=UPI0034669A17
MDEERDGHPPARVRAGTATSATGVRPAQREHRPRDRLGVSADETLTKIAS